MDTLAIYSNEAISLETLRDVLPLTWQKQASPDLLALEITDARVYICVPPRDQVESPQLGAYCLYLDYHGLKLIRPVVEEIAMRFDCTVDDDFGTVLPGNEFIAKMKTGWTWRE